jgi:hypothetical protein
MVHMLSLRSRLPYGGKVYREGEHFEAEDKHATLLVAAGVARIETVAERNHRNMYPSSQPGPTTPVARRTRRRPGATEDPAAYERRDLALTTKELA